MTLMMGGGRSTLLVQDRFRFRNDLEDEDTDAGWLTDLDTHWYPTTEQLATNFRVRIGMTCTDQNSDEAQDQLRMRFSYNKGTFTNLTNSSSPIQETDSFNPNFIHNIDTTQLITNDQAGDYFEDIGGNGCVIEGGNQFTLQFQWDLDPGSSNLQYLEVEDVLRVKPGFTFGRGDTVEFKLTNVSGININGGYTRSPIMAIQTPRVKIVGRELRINGGELSIK